MRVFVINLVIYSTMEKLLIRGLNNGNEDKFNEFQESP